MSKLAVSCDLDDTIMPNHFNYELAKDNVSSKILENRKDLDKSEVIDKINEFDKKRHRKNGITKERFANGLVDAVKYYVDNYTEDLIDYAYSEGMRPMKSPKEYNNVGTYDHWSEFAKIMNKVATHTVLTTAGIEDVQKNKIDGLGLESHFNELNIVDSGCKDEPLRRLNNEFESVIHIGNSLHSDIKPAEEVGIDAIHIKNSDWLGDYKIKNNSNVWQVDNLIQAANILENKY